MYKRILLLLSVFASLLISFLSPLAVNAAYDPLGKVDCSVAKDSAVCSNPGGDPLTGPNGALIKANNIIATIAGIAAVIFLILAGFKYITSGGAPDQVSKAKESIIYALVGLLIIAIGRQIINFVLSKV